MRLALAASFLLLFSLQLFATEGEYAVSRIPATLLKNAVVIKRYGEQRFEITSYTRARLYEKYAITILNDKADEFAYLYEVYDKLRSIRSIEGKLYDAGGKEIKSLKNKDIEDKSGVSGISLMEDNRVKLHSFYHKVYPYTVEYEVVTEYNNTLMFMPWFPQPAEKYAVEKSIMSVECPSWFTFRYKMFNYKGEPDKSVVKDKTIYTWQVNNLPAIIKEYSAPDFAFLTTCIFFSPDKFEFEGYTGTMTSWKQLGEFQLQLNKGRDKLPENVKTKVHELTSGITEPVEKVRVLYEYLQKNTRYISIQLGIGGLQPFDASYVASKAYGDCKALSNYMYALLKEVGIRSCYTQIKSGAGKYFFMPDFPSDQFDHIILCVPLEKDTMWLECTDQTLPAGYLGNFTCNRYALAIDENGGKLVRTPNYGVKENIQVRYVKGILHDDGTLTTKATTRYGGVQQDDIHGMINYLSKDKVKEYLHNELDFATYDINSFDYKENKTRLPSIDESLDITVRNYATITGKRLFIIPNVMTRTSRKLSIDTARIYDLELGFEYEDTDSVEITLPEGYQPEAMPENVLVKTRFGKYNCSVKLEGNKLFYFRNIEHYGGRFPAADYNELVRFYETIYKADRNRVVLVRK